MGAADRTSFLTEFLQNPASIGSVTPSSNTYSRAVVEWFDWPNVKAIAECGPGNGVMTAHILRSIRPGTKFFCVEITSSFIEALQKRFPSVPVHQDSAANLRTICDREGVESLDAVICGIPWSAIPSDEQAPILDAIVDCLRPGGQFATLAYPTGLVLPSARRFKKMLHERFSEVGRSGITWLNVPPGFSYRCRK